MNFFVDHLSRFASLCFPPPCSSSPYSPSSPWWQVNSAPQAQIVSPQMLPTVADGAGVSGQLSMEMLDLASRRVTMLLRDLVDQRRIAHLGLQCVQVRGFVLFGSPLLRYSHM